MTDPIKDILYVGDYAYSSWSLRGWLLFDAWDLPVRLEMIPFSGDTEVSAQMATRAAPARTVPTARFSDGAVAWDSLAIAEEVASRHPDAALWPSDPVMRARARSLAAEMHCAFGALRSQCPMNLRTRYADMPLDAALRADLDRLEEIFAEALEASGGPWLCGDYSVADAFFAPVAGRIAGFSLPVSDLVRDYVARHLAHPPFRRWRAMGLVHGPTLPWYAQDLDTAPWPFTAPRRGETVTSGTPRNTACPYSGGAPDHLLALDGHIWGFCNAFCRDKTAADPDAWPAFVAMEKTR